MKKRFIFRTLVIVFALIVALTSMTSCSGNSKKTLYLEEATTSGGCGSKVSTTKQEWIVNKIEVNVEKDVTAYLNWVKDNKTNEEYEAEKAKEAEYKLNGVTYNNGTDEVTTSNYKANLEKLIRSYAIKDKIANEKEDEKINAHFQVARINLEIDRYLGYVANITKAESTSIDDIKASINGSAGCFDVKTEGATRKALLEAETTVDAYRLASLYVMQVDQILTDLEPITFKGDTAGMFFSHLWNNLFVFPLAWLLNAVSSLLGGYYFIGLIIVTLIVRTLGWPIYAKSNDMSSKMSELQPELTAIQKKYEGRDDPDSKRMMQMEQAQLYKKHKIGFGGCLLPFLQFPIFMAIYRAISRIPYTKAIAGSTMYTNDWANNLKSTLFGIDLFETRNIGGVGQLIGVIVLALLVVGTQILSQLLIQRRQNKAREKSQEDVPAYKRASYNQTQNQSQSTMKMMMWGMTLMMGLFVWSSKAGLGLYWLIGNLYSMGQNYINAKTQEKKKQKKQEESYRNRGIFTVNKDNKKKKKNK